MGDIIEIKKTEDKEFDIEGHDSRNSYEKFEGSLEGLLFFQNLKKRVDKGEFIEELPEIAKKEAKIQTGKREWVNGKIEVYGFDPDVEKLEDEDPKNIKALYPSIKYGAYRNQVELQRAIQEEGLENIIASTPDDKAEALFKYVTPQPGLKNEYGKISKLHRETGEMQELLHIAETGKDSHGRDIGASQKVNVIKQIKDFVQDYIKEDPYYVKERDTRDVDDIDDDTGERIKKRKKVIKVKEDKWISFNFIMELIHASDNYAITKMSRILKEKSEEFEKAIKGKVPGYVRANLMKLKDMKEDKEKGTPDGNQYVLGLYQRLFAEKYEKKDKEE